MLFNCHHHHFILVIGILGMVLLQSKPVDSQDLLNWIFNLFNPREQRQFMPSDWRPLPVPLPIAGPRRFPPRPRQQQQQQPLVRQIQQQQVSFPVLKPTTQRMPPIFQPNNTEKPIAQIVPDVNELRMAAIVQSQNAAAASTPIPISRNIASDNPRQVVSSLLNGLFNEMKMSQFITSTPDTLQVKDLKVFNTVKSDILENAIFRFEKT